MHSKIKGNIGQLEIGAAFAKLGYCVFYECGDISKIDLIAEKNGKLIRVQCKAVTPTNNSIKTCFKKSGPGYQFVYNLNEIDFFAIYDLLNGSVYLIDTTLIKGRKNLNLRLAPAKNNRAANISFAKNFLIENVLK